MSNSYQMDDLSKIAEEVARVKGHGLIAQTQKKHAVTNYALMKGYPDPSDPDNTVFNVKVWLECTYINYLRDEVSTAPLPLNIWVEALKYAVQTGTFFVFAVQFKDQSIYYIKIDKYPVDMFKDDPAGKKCSYETVGTPAQKNARYSGPLDPNSTVQYVHIPIEALTRLSPC